MSLCSALDSQLEEFLLSNTSTGLGLNLSTNNGLDLTCPSYEEGLNLSQQNNAGTGQYAYNEAVVLNLTQDHQQQLSHSNGRHQVSMHHGMQQQQQQQQYSTFMQNSSMEAEVGLNLSLQKSYASQQQQHSQHQQQQNGFFGHFDSTSGYTFSVPMGSNTSQMDQQRNSPLNLEQRSSPLNLTSVSVQVSSGRANKSCQNFQYQSDFGFTTDNGGVYQQQQQQQQQQQTMNYSYYNPNHQTQNNDNGMFDQSNIFDDHGQFFVEASGAADLMVSQQAPAGQPVNKIRLFCSSCCTEFSSTADLNRHMERHQMEAMNVIQHQNGMDSNSIQHQQQQQMSISQQQQQQMRMQPSCSTQPTHNNIIVNKHQQTMPSANLLPHWPDNFSMTSSAPTVSMPTPLIVSNCAETVVVPCNTTEQPLQQHQQQQQQQTVLSNSDLTTTMAVTVKRKSTSKLPEMSNNSTKKLNEPTEMCSECSLMFPTGVDLKKHIDLAHQGRQGKLFQCSQCAQEFDEKSALKSHLEIHSLEKPFSCQKCGMNFTNQAGLKRHLKRIHEKSKSKTLVCKECGKSFFERHDLQRHEKIHNVPKCLKCNKSAGANHICKAKPIKDEPPVNEELKCKICSVQLETRVAWGYHMWKHTKDPSYIQSAEVPNKTINSDNHQELKNKNISIAVPVTPSKTVTPSKPVTSSFKSNLNPPLPSTSKSVQIISSQVLNFPPAPEAHAMSYTQISQPLCLQTSRLVVEEPIKPLNMQVIVSANQ